MSPEAKVTLGKAGMTAEDAMASFVAKTEKALQDEIGKFLNLRGIVFMRQRMDKRTTGTLGWPDFTMCVHHSVEGTRTPLSYEVKLPGKNLDPDQKTCIKKMLANGWAVYLVRSVAQAKEFLDYHVYHENPRAPGWARRSNITEEELQ